MNDLQEQDIEMIRIRVAERLGWRTMEYSRDGVLVGHPPGRRDIHAVPSYARDIRAVWEIIDLLEKWCIRVSIINEEREGLVGGYAIEIGRKPNLLSRATNRKFALTMCLAFLDVSEAQLQRLGQTTLFSRTTYR